MNLVLIKFVEVFARAAFVVGATYSLPLAEAGQFGLVATLIGLFAFAFNWERHVDIQRRYVDQPAETFDGAVRAALPFWTFNHLVMLPFFIGVAAFMAHLTAGQLALAVVIVSAEQIGNQTYQMALVTERYRAFLAIVAVKNIGVLAAVAPLILFAPGRLTLDYVLTVWAVGQAVSTAVIFLVWRRRSTAPALMDGRPLHQRIFAQHRASFTHFQIGIVAILMLQLDRLIAGTLLPLAETGVYFRHIIIVSFTYQFFNVASFNRIMPRVFAAAKTQANAVLFAVIRRELMMVTGVVAAGFAAACGLDAAMGGAITARYHLSLPLAGVLLAGALIRIVADFAGMILNARMQERTLFRRQLVAFSVGGVAMAMLTAAFGLFGTAAASVGGAALYLALIAAAVRRADHATVPARNALPLPERRSNG